MKTRSMKAAVLAVVLVACLPVPAAADDCAVEPKSNQKAVTIVVMVRDGEITLTPPAEQAVHLKQKSEIARWISSQGPFEITFDDGSVETPTCEQTQNNQWQCDSAAFCYRPGGTNEYKYTVTAGGIVLDPHVIIDK